MFFSRRSKSPDPVATLYAAIVAQSRQPVFFAQWGVADTLTGRFDMLSVHMGLVLRRLRAGGGAQRRFAQALFDLFFKDMDRSLREAGVGDLSVPKRIERMGTLFYGLLAALTEALDANDATALEGAVARNLLNGEKGENAKNLSKYIAEQADRLDRLALASLSAGHLHQETIL